MKESLVLHGPPNTSWRGTDAMSVSHMIVKFGKQFSEQISIFRHLLYEDPLDPNNETSFPMPPVIYGRNECIKQIVHRIEMNTPTLAILGPPGVGKTTVARALLYEGYIIEQFGARRHWTALGEVTSSKNLRDIIYESLASKAPVYKSSDTTYNHPNKPSNCKSLSSAKDRLNVIVNSLQTSTLPSLLVLDDLQNAWDHWRSEIERVLQELSTIPHLTILITMRGAKELPHVNWSLAMTTLSPRDAKLLFLTVYPNSDDQLDTLLRKVDYLPQIVVFVAHMCQTNHITPSALVKRWNEVEPEILQQQEIANSDNLDVSFGSWVDSASNQVSPEARMFLSILSMLPSGALPSDLQSLAPGFSRIPELIRVLTDVSLIPHYPDTRLRLLSPVRSHFVKYHELDEASRKGLYTHYFTIAKKGLYQPGHEMFPKAMEKLTNEQRNVEAILEDALDRDCLIAVEATLQYSSPRCAIQPRRDIVEKALHLAKKFSPRSLLTSRCLQRLGDMCITAGDGFRVGAEYLEQAVDLFKELDEPVAAAECRIGLAEQIWINNQRDGIAHLECTLQEFTKLRNVPGQARCSLRLGEMYLFADRIEEGRSAMEDALSKFNELNDRNGAAKCQLKLALTGFSRDSRLEDTRSTLQSALDNLQDFGDRAAVADGQRLLASLLLHEDRFEDARLAMKKAMEEFESLGRSLDAAFCMWKLAAFAEDDEAIELSQRAIPTFWSCHFTFAGAECRLDLGLRYLVMGRYNDALLALEIARLQLRLNKTDWIAAFCLAAIIFCFRQEGRVADAELALKNHRGELLAATRSEESNRSPWKLRVGDFRKGDFKVMDATDATVDKLCMIFRYRRQCCYILVNSEPKVS